MTRRADEEELAAREAEALDRARSLVRVLRSGFCWSGFCWSGFGWSGFGRSGFGWSGFRRSGFRQSGPPG